MSWDEDDLRAALRAGVGETPSADAIMTAAGQRRRQRRRRAGGIAATSVLVAGLATGGALLAGHGGDQRPPVSNRPAARAAGPAKAAPRVSNGAPAGSLAGGSAGVAKRSGTEAGGAVRSGPAGSECPARRPEYLLPGGGSPGRFGASGALFPRPVSSVVVCDYGSSPRSARDSAVFTGSVATELVQTMESGSPTPVVRMCAPRLPQSKQYGFAFLAEGPDGVAGQPVSLTFWSVSCQVVVATNGTAIRYEWQPPATVVARFPELDLLPASSASSPSRR